MAILTKGSNGVSYGYRHNVTAADETAQELVIDFQTTLDLVASIGVYDASGIAVDTSDMVVTYPEAGQIKIENGAATFALTEGQRVDILAQYSRGDV